MLLFLLLAYLRLDIGVSSAFFDVIYFLCSNNCLNESNEKAVELVALLVDW